MVDSIVSAVRDNAMLRPDRVAVIADDEKITYAQACVRVWTGPALSLCPYC